MRGFKLPIISDEDRKKQWDNLKQGDILISFSRGGWDSDYFVRNHLVIKKTPTGSVRLEDGKLLKVFLSNYYISTEELLDCIKMIELESEVMSLLYRVDRYKKDFKANLNYDDTIKLKEILSRSVKAV